MTWQDMPGWHHISSRVMKLSHCNCKQDAKTWYTGAVAVLAVLLLFSANGCSKKEDPAAVLEQQGWVSDYAGILDPDEKKRISAALESYEKETCHQVFLLIIPSLAGDNIVEFSQKTATAWDIGQPGFGNGFLVSIAMQEGSVRIETGSAFEWFIQNGTADKILKDVMFPMFRQEKFVEGIERGLEEIMTEGRLKPIPADHRPDVCR